MSHKMLRQFIVKVSVLGYFHIYMLLVLQSNFELIIKNFELI